MKKNDVKKGLLPYLFLIVTVVAVYYILSMKTITVNELTYDKLLKEVISHNVEKITITPKSSESIYYFEGKLKDYGEDEIFKVTAPYSETVMNELLEGDSGLNYEVITKADPGTSPLL